MREKDVDLLESRMLIELQSITGVSDLTQADIISYSPRPIGKYPAKRSDERDVYLPGVAMHCLIRETLYLRMHRAREAIRVVIDNRLAVRSLDHSENAGPKGRGKRRPRNNKSG